MNSVDPNQVAPCEPPDLDLHCLLTSIIMRNVVWESLHCRHFRGLVAAGTSEY